MSVADVYEDRRTRLAQFLTGLVVQDPWEAGAPDYESADKVLAIVFGLDES